MERLKPKLTGVPGIAVDAAVSRQFSQAIEVVNASEFGNGVSIFTRDVSIGGNAYTEAVQREFNLTFDRAEAAKQIGRAHV